MVLFRRREVEIDVSSSRRSCLLSQANTAKPTSNCHERRRHHSLKVAVGFGNTIGKLLKDVVEGVHEECVDRFEACGGHSHSHSTMTLQLSDTSL